MGGLPETRGSMEYTSSSTVSVELDSVNNDSSMSGDFRTACTCTRSTCMEKK